MTTSALKQNVIVDHFSYSVKKAKKAENMGAGSGKKLSNQEVQAFSQRTQLQPYVIQQIYDAFMDRAGKNGR